MQETCPRCDAVLPVMDGATMAYCGHCGLPQLRVSEVLQDAGPVHPERDGAAALAGAAKAVRWPLALRLCALAAAVGVLLSVLLPGALSSGVAGPLALLLLPLLTLATAAFYLRRAPAQRMSPGLGARFGVVIALFVTAGATLFSALSGFVLRYRFHSRVVEQTLNLTMAQMEAQVRATAIGTSADALLLAMHTPEWRAGMFLWLQLFSAFLLLGAGALSGAVAGAMLRARQQRNDATR